MSSEQKVILEGLASYHSHSLTAVKALLFGPQVQFTAAQVGIIVS